MSDLFSKYHNGKTRFTRMCIGEAVLALMDQKEFDSIKVSDIVKKAGVSRMTFYHYYETKEEALEDYFYEIVKGFLRECIENRQRAEGFQSEQHVLQALLYFDQYAEVILKMIHARLYYMVMDCMNDYMMKRILPHVPISEYELYYYGGAILNVFIRWEESGKKESAQEIAKIVANHRILPLKAGEERAAVLEKIVTD